MPPHSIAARLNSLTSHLTSIGTQPSRSDMGTTVSKEWKNLPSYDELPHFHEYPGCAWSVWGSEDQLGTVNLLTPDVVKRATSEEIR